MQKIEIPTDFLEEYKKAMAPKLISALELLQTGCSFSVKKEVTDKNKIKKKKTEYHELIEEEKLQIKKIIKSLNSNIELNLLTAKPNELTSIFNDIGNISDNLKQVLEYIFDYEKFKKNQIWVFSINEKRKLYRNTVIDKQLKILGRSALLENLKVKTCPYCNLHDVNYIEKVNVLHDNKNTTKTLNPAFDHYFPKSEYPYLAISLYNLIPACTYCNSGIKRKTELKLDKHLHPYEHSFHKKAKFSIKPTKVDAFYGNTESFDIEVLGKNYSNSDKAIETANFFGLKDRYKQHKAYASEILAKKQMYNDDWAESLQKMFPNLTSDDALRYYYGNYTNEEDINQRPLSKLTIDIIDQFDN